MASSVLIVDDEKNIRLMTRTVLEKHGLHAVVAENADAALGQMAGTEFALVLLDYMMPGMDGIRLLERMRSELPDPPPAVFMTAYGSVVTAVAAMKAGAVDYLSKPFTSEELIHVVERNLRTQRLEREVADLRAQVSATDLARQEGLVAESPSMKRLLATARQVAASKAPILIEGETGTGKEGMARFIHDSSPRAKGPFVAVNCGALHPELLLSELFGHKRGAFTGAVEDRVGRFEAADGGTLFLDEVGELDAGAQVKLLRALQEGCFERVGDPRTIHVDVRILAATNRRLEEMVAAEAFRADLYYRLAVITLYIPPLRERPEDIPPLAERFLQEFAREAARPGLHWSPDAGRRLLAASWPGNIRELRNAVYRSIVLASAESSQVDLVHAHIGGGPAGMPSGNLLETAVSEKWTLERLEAEYLRALLTRKGLTNTEICQILQIDASTLWRKRKKYQL